ncbi:helix-turn-helix domain-containing protein [Burkholderia cenocepacia]|uniref:IclR family transcriptional regulator n=1 Tax=Burkholderia cenocepacia TaxID=95486 RepID=UPI001B964D07|nr:helix-turn-helix domain-containing protein [Burkholderia cenocepacia]
MSDLEDSPGRDNGLYVASVEKAFKVLTVFSDSSAELGLTDVAARCGLGKSATQRFLHTLHVLGYLNQNPANKMFSLSAKLLALSRAYLASDVLRQRAEGILAQANDLCEETINLTILDDVSVVYILRFPSKHIVSVNLSVGTRLPAFCTAPGRVLLAAKAPDERDEALRRSDLKSYTDKTEVSPMRLRNLLATVREQGFALSDQETFLGDISVAAPVFDESGNVLAAINIAVPSPRWNVERVQEELAPFVVETAHKVSVAMGWRGGQTAR